MGLSVCLSLPLSLYRALMNRSVGLTPHAAARATKAETHTKPLLVRHAMR